MYPNLDDMSIDPADYDVYAADEANPPRLREYARYKAQAMRCRLAGKIAAALQAEANLEHIYQILPPELRW